MRICFPAVILALAMSATLFAQNKRDLAVRQDRKTLADNATWIYDDLDTALGVAAESRRPLMIVFR